MYLSCRHWFCPSAVRNVFICMPFVDILNRLILQKRDVLLKTVLACQSLLVEDWQWMWDYHITYKDLTYITVEIWYSANKHIIHDTKWLYKAHTADKQDHQHLIHTHITSILSQYVIKLHVNQLTDCSLSMWSGINRYVSSTIISWNVVNYCCLLYCFNIFSYFTFSTVCFWSLIHSLHEISLADFSKCWKL